MTPQQLHAINERVHQYFQNYDRCRLLIHALDKTLLTDAEFQKIRICRLTEDQLLDAPWALALFWGRLFYEKSDGNNYRRIIQDEPGIKRPDALFDRIHATCGWFPVDDALLHKRAYRFQAECWMTGAEGETSKLWKSLRRFIRRAVPGSSDQQICGMNASDDEDVTPPVQWLLKHQDSGFCDALRWLHTGVIRGAINGNSPRSVIAANPIYATLLRKDDFGASFGLRVTASRPELVLRIRNISFGAYDSGDTRELLIKQNNQIIFQGLISRHNPAVVLGERDFYQKADFSKPLQVILGNMVLDSDDIAPIPWAENELLLFRQSDDGNVSRYVVNDHKHVPHVQGRLFYVLGRPNATTPPALKLGNSDQQLIPSSSMNHALGARELFRLDLGGLHTEVAPLREQGANQPMAMIGKKPFLSIDPPPSSWRLHGGDETPVMLGSKEFTISAKNFIGSQISISVTNSAGNALHCAPHPNNPLMFYLEIGQEDWGTKWKVRATSEAGREEASSEYIFLPGVNWEGVRWNSSSIPEGVRFEHARIHGLQDGVLSYSGGEIGVLRAIERPTWAWSRPMEGFQDFNTDKQFIDHEEIVAWRVDYVMPPGSNWELRFNEQLVSSTSGRINLLDLATEHLGLDAMGLNLGMIDELQLIETANPADALTVSQIYRNPRHPAVGIVKGGTSIYIPADFQQAGWRLFRLSESNLLDGSLHEIGLHNYSPGDIHTIDALPPLMQDEGGWLVLLDLGPCRGIKVKKLMELGWILQLPQLTNCSVCEVAAEGAGQTFSKLLEIWKGHPLEDQDLQQVRSLLDLLEHCSSQEGASLKVGRIFARARSDRRLLGFGSRKLLNQYFDAELLTAVSLDRGALEKLFLLLLECGFNWFAEARWIETLPERMKNLLPQGKRCSSAMKKALKEACPLTTSFQLTHRGVVDGIPRIDPEFFYHRVNQGEIGLSVACPRSTVHVFQQGLPYRGFSAQRIVLQQPRSFLWPSNYRDSVDVRDSQGQWHPIVMKVTSADRAADFMADRISATHEPWFEPHLKARIRELFQRGLHQARDLTGLPRNPAASSTQLGLLFRACNARFMLMSRDIPGQKCRATIFQSAVLSRVHAWVTDSLPAPNGWPLSDPASYDQLARVISIIWSSPAHRKMFEKDIALIEWLITWFKNPEVHITEHI
jgi:hypothetical protein